MKNDIINLKLEHILPVILWAFCYCPAWSQTVIGKSNRVYIKVSKEPTGEKAALSYSDIQFKDLNLNQAIDPSEETTINFTIKNEGKGASQGLRIKAYASNEIKGLSFAEEMKLEPITPGKSRDITIPINGSKALESGTANVIIEIREEYEYDPDQIEINILTEELRK
jgi:hypothetical protein